MKLKLTIHLHHHPPDLQTVLPYMIAMLPPPLPLPWGVRQLKVALQRRRRPIDMILVVAALVVVLALVAACLWMCSSSQRRRYES